MTSTWPIVALGTLLTDIQPGFASGRHNSVGRGVPHFRPMNVSTDGRIDRRVLKFVETSAGRLEIRLRRGDILFNNTNSPELVGKTALFDDEDSPAFSNHMTRLRVDGTRLDPKFAALRLHQAWREGWFAAHCNNHVSQASIGRDVLKNFEIEIPPLDVQRAIASLSDSLEGLKSSSLSHLAAIRHTIEHFRQAVFAAACSGRLTADWREEHDDDAEDLVHSLSEISNWQHRPPLEPQRDLIDVIPPSWEVVSLDLLIDRIEAGKSFNALGRCAEGDEWGVIKVSAMSWGSFLQDENKAIPPGRPINPNFEIHKGDLLLSRANTEDLVGATVLVGDVRPRLLLSDKSLRLVPQPGIEKAWLNFVLRSPLVRSQFSERATGTSDSMRNLSQVKIRSTTLALPPSHEQREIGRRVEHLLRFASMVSQRTATASRQIDRSSQAVLAKAFRDGHTAITTDSKPRSGAA